MPQDVISEVFPLNQLFIHPQSIKVLEFLLNRSPSDQCYDINVTDLNGRTFAFYAAANGHVETLKTLAGLGADLNKANNKGATPVFIAAFFDPRNALKKIEKKLINIVNSYRKNENDMLAQQVSALTGHEKKLMAGRLLTASILSYRPERSLHLLKNSMRLTDFERNALINQKFSNDVSPYLLPMKQALEAKVS